MSSVGGAVCVLAGYAETTAAMTAADKQPIDVALHVFIRIPTSQNPQMDFILEFTDLDVPALYHTQFPALPKVCLRTLQRKIRLYGALRIDTLVAVFWKNVSLQAPRLSAGQGPQRAARKRGR